jgi:hypothetical protein
MAFSEKQQRALTNAAVAAGLTAVIGLLVVALLSSGEEVVPNPTPSTSPSSVLA